jgi:hypothetical protein
MDEYSYIYEYVCLYYFKKDKPVCVRYTAATPSWATQDITLMICQMNKNVASNMDSYKQTQTMCTATFGQAENWDHSKLHLVELLRQLQLEKLLGSFVAGALLHRWDHTHAYIIFSYPACKAELVARAT